MNLIEAVKSGKPFRRPSWIEYYKKIENVTFEGRDVWFEFLVESEVDGTIYAESKEVWDIEDPDSAVIDMILILKDILAEDYEIKE